MSGEVCPQSKPSPKAGGSSPMAHDFSSLPRVTLGVSPVLQAGVHPAGWRSPGDFASAWINCGNCWVGLRGGGGC